MVTSDRVIHQPNKTTSKCNTLTTPLKSSSCSNSSITLLLSKWIEEISQSGGRYYPEIDNFNEMTSKALSVTKSVEFYKQCTIRVVFSFIMNI